MNGPTRRQILGPEAVAVLERLAQVPWENIRELTVSTGLTASQVETAIHKLKELGLVGTDPSHQEA